MEPLLRVSAAAVFTLLACLLLRKTNPELAALLSIAAVALIALAALRLGGGLRELRELLGERFGLQESAVRPILKCLAAAVVTKLTADLCRDSSQSAAASAVELMGSLCALGLILPLLTTVLKMLEGFL